MILYIFGTDTFRSRQYLKKNIDQFKKQRDPHGYNTVILDGKKMEAGKMWTEVMAMPFLADKKMIVIENVLSNNDKELLGEILGRLKDKKFPENNVVIFWQGEPLSKIKEVKELQTLLSKEKYAQEFVALEGTQLSAWIQKETETRGGKIDKDTLQFLCQNLGGEMWSLDTVIDQLVAYAGGRSISLKDVQMFLEEKVDDSAFNMVDAIVSGNHKLAFKLLNEQRRLGEDDARLFGLILWQFKVILQIADLIQNNPSIGSDGAAAQLGIHPFVIRKNFAVARKYTMAQLERIYQNLMEIDIKTKTGQANQGLMIDLLVAKI